MISVVNQSNLFDEKGMLVKGNEFLRNEQVTQAIYKFIEKTEKFTSHDVRLHIINKLGKWSIEYLSDLGLFLERLCSYNKIARLGKQDTWILYTNIVKEEL